MSAFIESSVTVSFGKISAKIWGEEKGYPIVAIHGWLDNAAFFDLLAMQLLPYRVFALDLPGHWFSDHFPKGMTYSFLDWPSMVWEAARAFGLERFALVGHSLGGAIASFLALARPKSISALVLIESLGPLSESETEFPQRFRKFFNDRDSFNNKRLPVYSELAQAVALRRKATPMSAEAAEVILRRALMATPEGLTWRSDPRLKLVSPFRLTEVQIQACLREISSPSLIIRAENGLFSAVPGYQERQKAIRGAKVFTLPGGHHVHLEDAATVARAILDFLNQHAES